MYSKHEAAVLNQEFWTILGRYMSPILNADGEKINWINYKTGVKNIRFTMTAADKNAMVAIELSHKDTSIQQQFFDTLLQVEKLFTRAVGEGWQWQPLINDEYGKTISLVAVQQDGLNVLNKADWPSLISFFKQHMIALDVFWCENKFAFE